MNQNIEKFIELVKADEALQKELQSTADGYTGETTLEAVFHNILQPIAQKAGLPFTEEDCREYLAVQSESLNLDEMGQVSGGEGGAGVGVSYCDGVGGGVNVTGGAAGFGFCILVGYGEGFAGCAFMGVTDDPKHPDD